MTPSNPVLARAGVMIEHADFVPFLSGLQNLQLYWRSGGGDFASSNADEALAVADLELDDRHLISYPGDPLLLRGEQAG